MLISISWEFEPVAGFVIQPGGSRRSDCRETSRLLLVFCSLVTEQNLSGSKETRVSLRAKRAAQNGEKIAATVEHLCCHCDLKPSHCLSCPSFSLQFSIHSRPAESLRLSSICCFIWALQVLGWSDGGRLSFRGHFAGEGNRGQRCLLL